MSMTAEKEKQTSHSLARCPSLMVAVVSIGGTVLMSGLAIAYEDDVHLGLTQWLALQASFTDAEARTLADGTVSYDHSALSATNLVVHYACLKKDATVSQLVQENHFPGEGSVPGPPKDRSVTRGGPEALRKSSNQIQHPAAKPEVSIHRFGQGLHPLEDSWSHQGQPDSPLPWMCDANLSWGHPVARGGWRKHDADLTHLFPTDTLAMAEATYAQICGYADKVLARRCNKSFSSLAADVNAFAKANTKAKKQAWFTAHGIQDTSFLEHTTLPDGAGYEKGDASDPFAVRRYAANRAAQSEDARFILKFLSDWMTVKNTRELVKQAIEVNSFAYRIDNIKQFRTTDPEIINVLLALWRVRDHGTVATRLHDGDSLDRSAAQMWLDETKNESAPYESIEEALLPIDEEREPMAVTRIESEHGPLVVAAARFRHAPRDSVVILARKSGTQYRVVAIDSVVEN